MPIEKDAGWVSPLGEADGKFAELVVRDRHYVARYGGRVRDVVLLMTGEDTKALNSTTVVQSVQSTGGLIGESGKKLGGDSLRLAVQATLRWMTLRGELTSINGVGFRRIAEEAPAIV